LTSTRYPKNAARRRRDFSGLASRCQSNCGFAGWYSRLRGFFAIGSEPDSHFKTASLCRGARCHCAWPARQRPPRSASFAVARAAQLRDKYYSPITDHASPRIQGRGCGVGRGRGVTLGVAVGVVLAVAVGVAEGVDVGVGVAVGVAPGVGVGVGVGVPVGNLKA
jgi:hypothetical protein